MVVAAAAGHKVPSCADTSAHALSLGTWEARAALASQLRKVRLGDTDSRPTVVPLARGAPLASDPSFFQQPESDQAAGHSEPLGEVLEPEVHPAMPPAEQGAGPGGEIFVVPPLSSTWPVRAHSDLLGSPSGGLLIPQRRR